MQVSVLKRVQQTNTEGAQSLRPDSMQCSGDGKNISKKARAKHKQTAKSKNNIIMCKQVLYYRFRYEDTECYLVIRALPKVPI